MHQPRLESLKDTSAIAIQLVLSFSGLLGGFSSSHSSKCIAKSIFALMMNAAVYVLRLTCERTEKHRTI